MNWALPSFSENILWTIEHLKKHVILFIATIISFLKINNGKQPQKINQPKMLMISMIHRLVLW